MIRPVKNPVRFLLLCNVFGLALLWAGAHFSATPQSEPEPFEFPTKELAAIDRDLQARFAVVPEKDFGIMRTYGNQHYLYNPQTPAELKNIAALKQQKTEVAFYLMSRALWLRSYDGLNYKPIQGPVFLTGKINSPLPRKDNFMPRDNKITAPIIDQDHSSGSDGKDLASHNPDGTPVAAPTSPSSAPTFNQLQAVGNRVFELAETAPVTDKIGVSESINPSWKVVAVPIRASSEKCLPCHVYRPNVIVSNETKRLTVQLGDALGVAFYLYKKPPTKSE